jgi:integrase
MKGHIRQRSPGHWAIVLDLRAPDGSRRRKWHSFKGNKRAAQAECARLVTELKAGSYVEPSRLTLGEHLRDRVAQWEASGKISARTAERYHELINNQIAPHLGQKAMQKLKVIDIEAWHNMLASSGRKDGAGGVSRRTIGHAHRVLSKALADAARFDLVTKNVAKVQGLPAKVDDDKDEVSIVDADRLDTLLKKLVGRSMQPKAITALFTGVRRAELLALRWQHVNLDTKVLDVREALEETKAYGIRAKKPKTKAGQRSIALPDIVVEVLREHRRQQLEMRVALGAGRLPDNALVFPRFDGSPQSPRAFSAEWADFAASIGMADVTLHALRHTHASQLIDAGVDVVTISKRLGHSSPNITLQVYAHLFRSRDDKAADAINAALANPGGKR